jgi:hypothetical protein
MQFLSSLLMCVALMGCGGASDATEAFFHQHRAEFDRAVADARAGVTVDVLQQRYPSLCVRDGEARKRGTPGLGCEYSASPFVAEFTPLDFYYVLVFTDNEATVRTSYAMRDEGKVVSTLGRGWYLVKRGWM